MKMSEAITTGIMDGERVLEDSYPVNCGYLYVADEKVIRSEISGTVADLKQDIDVKEIRNCNIGDRNLWVCALY
jgi:hypothetical protein